MRSHRAVLHVYKDGESSGLGTLWQEICKFTAQAGDVPLLQAQLEGEAKKPGKSQLVIKDLVSAGRRVKGSCLGCQKEVLALFLWPDTP